MVAIVLRMNHPTPHSNGRLNATRRPAHDSSAPPRHANDGPGLDTRTGRRGGRVSRTTAVGATADPHRGGGLSRCQGHGAPEAPPPPPPPHPHSPLQPPPTPLPAPP